MTALIIIVIVVVIIAALLIGLYNRLVRLNVRADEAWSDVNVQLKRRYDLIPNLVNSVKGYAKHESGVLESVTAARANALSAQTVEQQAAAENQLQTALKSLFAVAEAYPDLKASQNFIQLQDELVDTEDKIQASRRFYNGVARDFNSSRQVFPANVIAGMIGFKTDRTFFELDEAEAAAVKQPVNVQF
ncbi:MAG: hypothetical protein JWM37_915 [Candidatus Saccharibacteria bacterium]|nr:hypothetical protein [Candidatus Saccharibacteria bacterium]